MASESTGSLKTRLLKIMQPVIAGEVKVLPNQTHNKLKQRDRETNFSHSAYRQVRVAAILKHNVVELYWGRAAGGVDAKLHTF